MQETHTHLRPSFTSHTHTQTHKSSVENHFNCFYQSVVTWDFLPRGWEMSPGTQETQILMPDAHKACVWWIWTAVELQVKQKSVLVWFVSNVVISDPLGLIARLESESSCVHFFRRQDVLQKRNEFTFHCTKNPAAHLSSIRMHLPLLFWSFPPSWDSSWSTSWWKSPSLLFHFHTFSH